SIHVPVTPQGLYTSIRLPARGTPGSRQVPHVSPEGAVTTHLPTTLSPHGYVERYGGCRRPGAGPPRSGRARRARAPPGAPRVGAAAVAQRRGRRRAPGAPPRCRAA